VFCYSNSNYYILSRIIHAVAGMKLDAFLSHHLFMPLGITYYSWASCPFGESQGGTGLYISTENMAKLGLLYVQNGIWRGERILSENWVYEATKYPVPRAWGYSDYWRYGLGIYVSSNGFSFGGSFGQIVLGRKDHNLVLAAHAFDNASIDYDDMLSMAIES